MSEDLRFSTFMRGLRVQRRVIGAVMLRELHTRFGRDNIGYAWLVVEPLILAFGVTVFHLFTHTTLPGGFTPGSFYASGYIAFIVFRNNVNRSVALIESNKPLLFHRQVTLVDISLGRSLLEVIASIGAMIIVLSVFFFVGESELPERPAYVLLGVAVLFWLSASMGMIITASAELFPITERIVHPMTYLMLPLTGMFFVLDWMPRGFSNIAKWFVIPQATDIVRMGLRADFSSTYVDPVYIVCICTILTLMGLLMLRVARNRMHFD